MKPKMAFTETCCLRRKSHLSQLPGAEPGNLTFTATGVVIGQGYSKLNTTNKYETVSALPTMRFVRQISSNDPFENIDE